jgi:DNA-binding NarL/FixJ family response regulator
MNKKLNIMIIDDHELFRNGMRKLFEKCSWVNSCCDKATVAGGLQAMKIDPPDILLLDLYLGHDCSFKLIDAIRETSPKTKIIMLTVSDSPNDLQQAVKQRVDGYLAKNMPFSKLEEAIQDVHHGKMYISESLANSVFQALYNIQNTAALTQQERIIMQHVQKGMTNREIAVAMFISIYTVKNHVSNIMRKMNVSRRYQLINKS